MNGYSKFRENSGDHTARTSSPSLEECQEKDPNQNPDNIIPTREPNTMKSDNFVLKRNHTTTSQRFPQSNSDLKNMMRRAFSTRKAYWRLEDDVGNGEVGYEDFGHKHDWDRGGEHERGSNNNIEAKKKKKIFKRWKKIFHF